jgi:Mrp family chromosome partitioning ATPase
MLEALKRIEAGPTQPPSQSAAASAEQPAVCVPPQPQSAPQMPAVNPLEAIYGDAVVQAALEQVEIVCEAVAAATAPVLDGATEAVAPVLFQPPESNGGVDARLVDHVLSQASSGNPAVLMFTSPEDGSGKTGVLSALAAVLAERFDGELLMVDGNLRQPELSGRWGVTATRGLTDVLRGKADWRQVVCPTAVPRLSVLPGVKPPADETRLLERWNTVGPLWQELGRCYRLVLVDTASLAHEEAVQLARVCSGTYLVVRLGHTSRRALAESVEVLQQCRGRLLGCVVLESY